MPDISRVSKQDVLCRHVPMSSTHCGWSLYNVPSTPTVMSKWSRPRFSLILSTTAAIPAPHSWAARCDTTPHTWATKKSRCNPEEVCGATSATAATLRIKVSFVPSRIFEPFTKRSQLHIVTLAMLHNKRKCCGNTVSDTTSPRR